MTKKLHSWFWPVQTFAWIFIGLANFVPQRIAGHASPAIQYLNFAGMTVGGFVVTSLYRLYLKRRRIEFSMKPGRFVLLLSLSVLVQTVCWMILLLMMTMPFVSTYHIRPAEIGFNFIPLGALLLVWNVVYLGYHLILQYHHAEVEKWHLEAEVQKAHLGNLRSQINPHFMFNSLNNIRALILENPQRARDMLTMFSENFRYALQHADMNETTVGKEINIVKQYLELVGIQYEDRLEYKINANDNILDRTIPPMILQLLAENAVKHGIALSPKGGIIIFDICEQENQLILAVKNTGTLQQKNKLEDSNGIGLKNTEKRLKLIYNEDAQLQISEQPPFVTVTIAINHNDKSHNN